MTPGLIYIQGEWKPVAGGATFEHRNPADLDEVTGLHADAGEADTLAAVDAAAAAWPAWRATPPAERAAFLRKALAEMDRRRDAIARQITLENGKTLAESHAEIRSAMAEMEFQINEGLRLYGKTVPSATRGVFAYSLREPLGVAAIITPWNFPWNVPGRKCTPALMAGNTVVLKPASLAPGVGRMFADLFDAVGLPPGVLNFVTGGGRTVGNALVTHPDVKAVSFTGSTGVGRGIHESAAKTLARTQLEMGGKNAAVVLADADLDRAAEACAVAAYACAGQWCTSTSRAIVERSVHDAFLEKLLSRVRALRVGRGTDEAATMGPVCGRSQLEGVLKYIAIGKEEGAELRCGGVRLTEAGLERGCFVAPTLFDGVRPDMTIAREEIFGPVLSVMTVDSFDEAVAVTNDVDFGLSASVFTRDVAKSLQFVERAHVGLTHVNIMTAHKEPALCFGGFKCSGAGLPEAGQSGIEFFTEEKVAYIRYD